MVLKKFLKPLYLFKTENFYIYKMLKIIIINKNINLEFISFYIILPYYKSFNNS